MIDRDIREVQQDIYQTLLATKEITSQVLEEVKLGLERLLAPQYTKNEKLASLAATNPLNPVLTNLLEDETTKQIANSYHKIHQELVAFNKEIATVQNRVTYLYATDTETATKNVANNQNNQLSNLSKLSESCKKLEKAISKRFFTVPLLDPNIKNPETLVAKKKELDHSLGLFATEAAKLRNKVRKIGEQVNNIEAKEETPRFRPGHQAGKVS